jgi:putative sigma-54 modulation protein
MQYEVRARDFAISDALGAHIDRKLELAVRRFHDRVRRVTVRLGDLNGPRGGVDKRCTIVLSQTNGETIVVHADSDDAYAAVTRAANSLDEQLARRLRRDAEAAWLPWS